MAKTERKAEVQHDVEYLDSLNTMAAKIRYLATIYQTDGKEDRGTIAKILDIRYQWVRNVLITPLKKK